MSESEEPPKSPTNKDIMNFLTSFKESIHTEISQAVRHEVAVTVRDKVAETVRAELTNTVRTEIVAAVEPLKGAQKELLEEIEATKSRVSEMVLENENTKSKVEELQRQMITIQQEKNPPSSIPPYQSVFLPTGLPPRHASAPPTASTAPPPSTTSQPALQVLQNAKKVLGFSPITIEDISHLKAQHGTDDDARAMHLSIKEFLSLEMKVPSTVLDTINILNVFPPAKNPTNWKTLYAEFPDSATTDLINQYARNLLPGRSVSIYVPHSLFPRFAAVRDIEHSYRNGDIKHKTRIKYGTSDFVLIVKPRDTNSSWTYVSLSSLPPLQLSMFDGNLTSSPPPGRTRLASKRARSGSPEVDLTRNNKPRISDVSSGGKEGSSDSATPPEQSTAPNSSSSPAPTAGPPHTCSGPAPPSMSDLGSFHPSACVSPRAVSNKSFTFTNRTSSIPIMKNSLNC